MKLTIAVETDESGIYTARVLEVLGCHTQGATLKQVLSRLPEAIGVSMVETWGCEATISPPSISAV